MDNACCLWSLHTFHESPSAALVGTCCEECLQVEQLICRLDKTSHSRLLQAHILQEHLTLVVILQLGDIGLGSCCHDKHLGILVGNSGLNSLGVSVARHSACLIDIADVQHRLIGQKIQISDQLALLLIGLDRTSRAALLQRLLELHEQIVATLGVLVASGSLLLAFAYVILYCLQILQLQLCVDNTLVTNWINRAIDVGDVTILKAAQNVDNSIGIADIAQELVTQALTLRCTLYQTCDIDNLDSCRDNLLWVINLSQLHQALIGYGDNANVGLDSTEREICRLRLCV